MQVDVCEGQIVVLGPGATALAMTLGAATVSGERLLAAARRAHCDQMLQAANDDRRQA